jgi:hypothetical protein
VSRVARSWAMWAEGRAWRCATGVRRVDYRPAEATILTRRNCPDGPGTPQGAGSPRRQLLGQSEPTPSADGITPVSQALLLDVNQNSYDSDFGANAAPPWTLQAKISLGTGHRDDGEYLAIGMTRLSATTSTGTVTVHVSS